MIPLLALGCQRSDDTMRKPPSFDALFGSQAFDPIVFRGKLERCRIELRVVARRPVVEESANPLVTLIDGVPKRITRVDDIGTGDFYLFGSVQLTGDRGRIYDCVVGVRDGPLRGAVVRICDGKLPHGPAESPYQAVYPISGYDVLPGPVEFEVVMFRYK